MHANSSPGFAPSARKPDIAVAIVTFRVATLTIACLDSIARERATTALPVRVVVVDNASGDAPSIRAAVADNDWTGWVKVVEAPRNGGFAYGNNIALKEIYSERTPDYVHLLNPDTVVGNGGIAGLADFLERNPEVGIAGSALESRSGKVWAWAFRFPGLLNELDHGLAFGLASRLLRPWSLTRAVGDIPEQVDWVPGASMMVREKVFSTIGGLDENFFLYYEETEFLLRALRAGFPTWYVPSSRVMHLVGQSTNVTNAKPRSQRLPGYWFESRRRYYQVAHGLGYAIAADLIALLSGSLGMLKRWFQFRGDRGVPYYLRDLYRHSTLRKKNRGWLPLRSFRVGDFR